ncbi:metallophosphoesterase [uncultured Gilliamella sp.]|uniref:metallophosphoesterase n=1 Tax=uncultured Gilliamella sp. TaxID=1193505 RepID=UPI0025D6CC41|nr:metallophosphoesterase [uncultured Gilliamella sp.]
MAFVDLFTPLIAIFVSGLATFYLGKRWQFWFDIKLTGCYRLMYWSLVAIAFYSLIIARLANNFAVPHLVLFFNCLASVVICASLLMLLADVIYLASKKRFKPKLWFKICYVVAVISLCFYGYSMAVNPTIVHYHVNIDKSANVDHLRFVHLSDIHLSESTSPKRIEQMVEEVNQQQADFIVITGDTLDRRLAPFTQRGFAKQFQQLKSKYGTFVIFGNHEYYHSKHADNHEQDIIDAFEQANMKVLKDDVIYLDDVGITLIGRDDLSSYRYHAKRASLADLMMFSDSNTPIILLDHQPSNLDKAANLGVDLMLSGHTHGGQIFPINLVVDIMYKNPYGLYQDTTHHFTSIVSSGFGFGSPPIRLMTRGEIGVIDVTFNTKP